MEGLGYPVLGFCQVSYREGQFSQRAVQERDGGDCGLYRVEGVGNGMRIGREVPGVGVRLCWSELGRGGDGQRNGLGNEMEKSLVMMGSGHSHGVGGRGGAEDKVTGGTKFKDVRGWELNGGPGGY